MGNICTQKEINKEQKKLRLIGCVVQDCPNKQSGVEYYSYKISDNTDNFEDEFYNKNFQFENLNTLQANKQMFDIIITSTQNQKNDKKTDEMSYCSLSQFLLDEKQTCSKKIQTQSKSVSKNDQNKYNKKTKQKSSARPSISSFTNQSPKSILKSPQNQKKTSKKCKEQDNQSQKSVRFRNSSLQQHQLISYNKSPQQKRKPTNTEQRVQSYQYFHNRMNL